MLSFIIGYLVGSRIAEPPTWYDENGTPRYGVFHPDMTSDIYADEVALVVIGCQGCLEQFKVAMTFGLNERLYYRAGGVSTLHEQISTKVLHYGDPPNHADDAGNTMNCLDLKVLEYWRRPKDRASTERWERDPAFETDLEDAAGVDDNH